MAEIFKNSKLWLDGYELSCDSSAVAVEYSAEAVDQTALCNDTRVIAGGLKVAAISINGFVDDVAQGAELFDAVAVAGKSITVGTPDTAEGSKVFCMDALISSMSRSAPIGESETFEIKAEANSNLINGTLAKLKAADTANSNGTAYQLGALSAGKKLYAVLHVTRVDSGSDELDVVIQSASSSGFSSPATRITFGTMSGVGSQWIELDATTTHSWFRAKSTISGEFDYSVSLAVQ